jgi:hypothetical protein
MSVCQTVRSVKCPFGKTSVRQNVRSAKRPSAGCPFGKMSFGKMSFGKVSFGKMSGHRFFPRDVKISNTIDIFLKASRGQILTKTIRTQEQLPELTATQA